MLKRNKIIYFVGGPLTQRWLDYYCIDDIAECFDVEFWDCSSIVDHPYRVSASIDRPYVKVIASYDDLRAHLKQLPKNTIGVQEMGFIESNYSNHYIISKYIKKCVVIDFWTYTLLTDEIDGNKDAQINTIKQRLYHNKFILLVAKFVRHGFGKEFQNAWRRVNKNEINWGEKCSKLYSEIYEFSYRSSAQYVINHPDYEKYLSVKEKQDRKEKYIVYMGQYYPLHPEYKVIEPNVNFDELAEPFYKSLNRFFDLVEKQYGCKVVLAEHPTGRFENNPFNGREIVFYKTAELVRDSIGVCMHCSNSFSYVALWDKPVAILDCKALQVSQNMGPATRKFAQKLCREVVDMDHVKDVTNVFQPIDRDVRSKYLSMFADINNSRHNAELMKEHFIDIANR